MLKPRDDTTQHIREIIEGVELKIAISRNLREISQNLRQENADLRELLRENLLTCWSKREHWRDT